MCMRKVGGWLVMASGSVNNRIVGLVMAVPLPLQLTDADALDARLS